MLNAYVSSIKSPIDVILVEGIYVKFFLGIFIHPVAVTVFQNRFVNFHSNISRDSFRLACQCETELVHRVQLFVSRADCNFRAAKLFAPNGLIPGRRISEFMVYELFAD